MELSFRPILLRLAHAWTIARTQATNTAEVVVVELRDRQGTLGRGEAAPVKRYNESAATVADFLKRVDPSRLSFSDIEGSMIHVESIAPGNHSAKCALNVALLDGASRQARLPLHEFLKLDFRERHHVTSFTIGIDTPDVIRQKVQSAEPYPVLKMKVGVVDDQDHLRALREMAPLKPVRVDANEGWRTREEALRMIEWLAQDGHVQFVEQPLPASAPPADHTWLKEHSPLPIFADESFHSADDVESVASHFHGVNVKLVKAGGVTRALGALRKARAAGLQTMIGCMIETSLLISAAAHLCELCDYVDLDGNLLITNDPYLGVSADAGILSFVGSPELLGLRAIPRKSFPDSGRK